MSHSGNPTVVLVHGAFADASSYAQVIPELLARGLDVTAPAVPNRSLLGDAAYIASVVRQIPGPVILVGHSYGGAVITVAGVEDNVSALVYLAGFALEEGESLGELQARFPSPGPDLGSALVSGSFPITGSTTPGTEVSVAIDEFPALVAADVDPALASVLAVSQRPLATVAFSEKAPVAAWRTKPSWGMVASADLNPAVERYGYRRAGMTVVEVDSAHLVMLSHPKQVAELIHQAVLATVR
ncbi:alpha/beta fold hydrolase [Streptomyces sp. NPDC002513]